MNVGPNIGVSEFAHRHENFCKGIENICTANREDE